MSQCLIILMNILILFQIESLFILFVDPMRCLYDCDETLKSYCAHAYKGLRWFEGRGSYRGKVPELGAENNDCTILKPLVAYFKLR